LKIALDVDGVLADFVGYISHQVGADPKRQKTWHFEDSFPPDQAKRMYALMDEADTWAKLRVKPWAGTAVRILDGAGVEFHFVTAVPERFAHVRQVWLRRLGVDLEKHLLLPIRSTSVKAEFCEYLGFTHVVDDSPRIVNAVAELGMAAILVPSTYMWELPLHPNVRVQKLLEFVREVEGAPQRFR
jgi:hypothetical protein